MTFEQLHCFIRAVESDTFFDAAEQLHITQSALSKQIMKLEQELDVRLFDRSRRSAVLTDAGAEFYREALVLYAQYKDMLAHMLPFAASHKQDIRLGTLPVLMQYQLTTRFQKFSHAFPDIRLVLEEAEEDTLLQELDRGHYDFIIAREHLVKSEKYEAYPLAADELIVLIPNDHPLLSSIFQKKSPSAPSLSLDALAAEPLLLMHRYTSVYCQCMEQFQKYKITPHILRNARPETIISAVAVGEGIGLVPRSSLELFPHTNITPVSLFPSVPLNVVLAKRKRSVSTPSMQKFIQFMEFPASRG